MEEWVSANRVRLCIAHIKQADNKTLDFILGKLEPFLRNKQKHGCVKRSALSEELWQIDLPSDMDDNIIGILDQIFDDEEKLPTISRSE